MSEHENESGEPRRTLNGNTLIPLSLVFALLVQSLVGYAWLERRFTEMEKQLLDMHYQGRDRWTGSDQRSWVGELAVRNRTLDVPPARHVDTGDQR